MYKNWCRFIEKTNFDNEDQFELAPRPPCRSFCAQVAEVCANDHHFLQLCGDIACPPAEQECEKDPTIMFEGDPRPLEAKWECDMPYQEDPYGKGVNTGSIARPSSLVLALSSVILALGIAVA